MNFARSEAGRPTSKATPQERRIALLIRGDTVLDAAGEPREEAEAPLDEEHEASIAGEATTTTIDSAARRAPCAAARAGRPGRMRGLTLTDHIPTTSQTRIRPAMADGGSDQDQAFVRSIASAASIADVL
jgi:hypothetical protein